MDKKRLQKQRELKQNKFECRKFNHREPNLKPTFKLLIKY